LKRGRMAGNAKVDVTKVKEMIMTVLAELGATPQTKEEVVGIVKSITGYELVEGNYVKILQALMDRAEQIKKKNAKAEALKAKLAAKVNAKKTETVAA